MPAASRSFCAPRHRRRASFRATSLPSISLIALVFWLICDNLSFLVARPVLILSSVATLPPEGALLAGWRGPKNKGRNHMANEKSQSVQDVFLNNIRKSKMPVTVFLVNGVKLQGIITWFDNFSVLLRRDAHSQLVYKHAISTIMPAGPLQLFEGSKEGEEA